MNNVNSVNGHKKPHKVIYVIENENGKVKIGVAIDPNIRKSTIESIGGNKIIKMFCTAPCSNSFRIEKALHDIFSAQRKCGEWFNVDFDTAVETAQTVYDNLAEHDCKYEKSGTEIFKDLNSTFENTVSPKNAEQGEIGGVANLIKELSIIMKAQNSSPRKIALMTEGICKQFGVNIPVDFVEKED